MNPFLLQLFTIIISSLALFFYLQAVLGTRFGRKSCYIWLGYSVFRIVYQQIFFYYQEILINSPWRIMLDLFFQTVGIILYLLILRYIFCGDFVKICIWSYFLETTILGIIVGTQSVLLLYEKTKLNNMMGLFLTSILSSIILRIAYRLFYLSMISLQKKELKHTRLWGIVVMLCTIFSIISHIDINMLGLEYDKKINSLLLPFLIVGLILLLWYSYHLFKNNKKQKNLLEMKVEKMKVEDHADEKTTTGLTNQSKKIQSILNDMVEMKVPFKKEKMLNQYIRELKESFEEIEKGFYCKDPEMDAFLYTLVKELEKHHTKTEIHFQGYQANMIPVKELESLLWNMMANLMQLMDLSSENHMIFRASNHTNQLIIWITLHVQSLPENVMKKYLLQCKKQSKTYLNKYHGIMVQEVSGDCIELKVMMSG